VHQWSFGSYVEDQDQWWLSGIFRPVTLLHRPPGSFGDVEVRASYDHVAQAGALTVDAGAGGDGGPARVALPELGLAGSAGVPLFVPGAEPWSAEHPRLYEVVIENEAETVRMLAGFRTVDIHDGVLRLNGQPLVFRGVNRHDFDPVRGRAVSRETMERDVVLMKRHNVNAVRTSHYPPDPYLLELCDRYGLYVVEECDFETHGFGEIGWRGNPSDDPAWAAVCADRMTRMVERDKNATCVVMWSLGNESGWGRSSVRDLQTRYVVPQENGNRSAVRWFSLTTPSGRLRVDGDQPFDLAIRPWSTADLERATHDRELREGAALWVHLAAGVTGLGTATCGPGVAPQTRLLTERAVLSWNFSW
jgi:beta-galactosidase